MDEEHLVVQNHFSFLSIFKNIYQHFLYGNGPGENHNPINEIHFGLSFDSHPGPIEDCITDAKNNQKFIFLFIYCQDNPKTQSVVRVLQDPQISRDIRENFIFYPVDITWPDGWDIATQLGFNKLPLIALIRPRGSTLWESNIFMKNEGHISKSNLAAAIHNEHSAEQNLINQQNNEFHDAERQDEETEIRLNEEAEQALHNQEQVNEAFQRIPINIDPENSVLIRFRFPNNTQQTREFPSDGPISYLFAFVRKYMYPSKFCLLTGFPQITLEENDAKIQDMIQGKQNIVYVEEIDDE